MADILDVRIESPALSPDATRLFEMHGREAISQLFGFDIHLTTLDPAGIDEDALLASPAVLVFSRGGEDVRRIGGMIAQVHDRLSTEAAHSVYTLSFVPRAYRMSLVHTSEIFMDLSVPEIVKAKLERAGLTEGTDYELRLGRYPAREFVVQYQETDLAFVSRLTEHLGIYFFFEQSGDDDVIVFADANSGSRPIAEGADVAFHARGEHTGVYALSSITKTVPSRVVVKDYNYRTPAVPLLAEAKHRDGGGLVVEYGAHFKTPDEGAKIAEVRAEELRASRKVWSGRSDAQTIAAGATFALEGHPRGDLDLLVTEVTHRAVQGALGAGNQGEHKYENEFQAIPRATQYRPPRVTPKPKIHGVITGNIDAAAKGPYAELDSEGRYRVRFMFDTSGAEGGKASRLVRMAQPHAGGGYGMHFPLRSGVEVVITFVEGDPDRPIITGTVPNAATPGPVTSGNSARNIIRTGGNNEINIDDTAGSERIKFSTPHANTVFQLGARNADGFGGVMLTDKSMSTQAKEGFNVMTAQMNTVADVVKIITASDTVQFCTGAANLMAIVSAIGNTGANLIPLGTTHLVDPFKNSWEPARKKAAEEIADAQADVDREQSACEGAESRIAMLERREAAGFDVSQELEKARRDLEGTRDTLDQRQDMLTQAKWKADKLESDIENSWTKANDSLAEGAKGIAEGANQLISDVSTFVTAAGNAGATLLAEGMVVRANAYAAPGRVTGVAMPIVSPSCLYGAAVSAAIVGGVNTFVGGQANAVLYSDAKAVVVGTASAVIKSLGETELYGGVGAYITARGFIKHRADGFIETVAGTQFKLTANKTVAISSLGDAVEIFSGKGVAVEATETIRQKAGKDIGVESTGGTLTLKSKGTLTLDGAESKAKLTLEGDSATLQRGEKALVKVETAAVDIKLEGSQITVTRNQVVQKAGDGGATLIMSKDLAFTGKELKFTADGTLKLDGNKIYLS